MSDDCRCASISFIATVCLNTDVFQKEKSKAQNREEAKGETREEAKVETRGETRGEILRLITEEPKITMSELAEKIGITGKGIEYQLRNLRKENIVRRVGPTKGGHWEIIDQEQ